MRFQYSAVGRVLTGGCLLLLTSSSCRAERSTLEVTVEYRLQVNNLAQHKSTQHILDDVDSEILYALQEQLPNGQTGGDPPNVQFETIGSEIYSACFTHYEQCSLVRSIVSLTYEGEKPRHALAVVTYRLMQDYFQEHNENHPDMDLVYLYPMAVQTRVEFGMTLPQRMNPVEVGILESTFVQVFGAIVGALEGDDEIVNGRFIYQDLREYPPSIDSNSNSTKVLVAQMLINGLCRECNDAEFANTVDQVIQDNLGAFENQLVVNSQDDAALLKDLKRVTYKIPKLPSGLPPIADESIYDKEAPDVDKKIPWWFWLSLSGVFVAAGIGAWFIRRERIEFALGEDTSWSESGSSREEYSEQEEDLQEEEGTVGNRTHLDTIAGRSSRRSIPSRSVKGDDDGQGTEVSYNK